MSERKFYVTCLFPTATITKGKDYVIEEDGATKVTIYNDHGNKISLMKYRFGDIKVVDGDPDKAAETITCKSAGTFKSITKGKVYKITKESRDFFYIKNNLGSVQRYGKKYFNRSVPPKPEAPAKKEMAVCVYPVLSELSFKEVYEFTNQSDDNIKVKKNDKGMSGVYLKKRFSIEMR